MWEKRMSKWHAKIYCTSENGCGIWPPSLRTQRTVRELAGRRFSEAAPRLRENTTNVGCRRDGTVACGMRARRRHKHKLARAQPGHTRVQHLTGARVPLWTFFVLYVLKRQGF